MEAKEFLELMGNRQLKEIKVTLGSLNAVDLANLLSALPKKEMAIAFRLIDKEKASKTFAYMESEEMEVLLNLFSDNEIKNMMDAMFTDDTVDMIEEMPANVVHRILQNISEEDRNLINAILQYPKDSAGSIMTTEYVRLHPDMTVQTALEVIKETGIHKETIYTCYVTKNRQLVGMVTAKDLLTSEKDTRMSEIMTKNVITVHTHDDKEDVANKFRKYGVIAIPVVDHENCIVGIVTFDDAFEVLTSETTEDITKMAAINPSEDSYFKTSVLGHAKNRIFWLLVLMLSSTVTGMIITNYEKAFEAIPMLVSFIPMLMSTGGNCGSQSATLVIRGIAVDEIQFKHIFKVMWKEFRVALLVSIILAFANGMRIFIMYHNIEMAVVIAMSLIGIVLISKIIGCALPLLAKKAKLDPAIMASPLITTLVDTCSICIYFAIATRVFDL